jgi:SAM-dependent methyltransferase
MFDGMAGKVVPERVRWAVELVDPGPEDRILEIGCGPGAAAELICERLRAGRLTAIDRSATATKRTKERNAEHIKAGRLAVQTASLDAIDLPKDSLDAAFSINVNVFWTRSPKRELEILANALKPGGALYICYGAGPQETRKVTAAIADALTSGGFTNVQVRTDTAGTAVTGLMPR